MFTKKITENRRLPNQVHKRKIIAALAMLPWATKVSWFAYHELSNLYLTQKYSRLHAAVAIHKKKPSHGTTNISEFYKYQDLYRTEL